VVTDTLEPITIKYKPVFGKIVEAFRRGKRRCFLEGSSWASKTYSVMQFLKEYLSNSQQPLVATVSSESLPHLKRGCIRDFINIMGDELKESCYNRTDFVYTFPKSKSTLEFVSADSGPKFTGARRDILFCNELNHIPQAGYRQADMRTRLFTIADWNPESEFWFHDEHLADLPENELIHCVFTDVLDVVPETFIRDMEVYKTTDPNYYRVYALGLIGELTGLVYPYVTEDMMVDELPKGYYFYGLDYGSLVDPCVLVKNVIEGDKLYSQEMFYEYGMDDVGAIDKKIAECKVGGQPIFPDPDEPLVSNELAGKYHWNIMETVKGPGSVAFGIKMVNSYFQFWTKDSTNCIKEQRNYRYLETQDERDESKRPSKAIPTSHRFSHGMDARRYAVASYKPARNYSNKIPSSGPG
jgi:phage terminase large subunit